MTASDLLAQLWSNAVPRRLILLDVLAAAGFVLLPWVAVLRPATSGVSAGLVWALSGAIALPLCVRRLWPTRVFLLALVLSCAALPFGLAPTSLLAAAYAIYPVALTQRRPFRVSAVLVGGVSAAGAAVLILAGSPHYPVRIGVTQIALGLVALGATWAVGAAVGERREAIGRAIEQAAERARIEERLRVSRDIHDVATHSIGLIAVKAGVANHVLLSHPEEARNALTVIEEVSRTALRDMRSTLRALRPDQYGLDGPWPHPSLGDLPALVEAARAADIDARLDTKYGEQPPGGAAVSAYRIIQEALTNVIRHAAPTRCQVMIAVDSGVIEITISDDGPGPGRRTRDLAGGLGLIGMRERVALHGGTLAAGPRPSGGFQVSAVLRY